MSEPRDQTTDEAIRLIAGFIDHPSIYMGGPSDRARKLATKIWEALKAEGYVTNG